MTDTAPSASAAGLPRADSAPARLAVQPPGSNRLQIHSTLACLDGQRATVDPTGLLPLNQTVRLAHGRDAKEVAFAIISGPARLRAMSPRHWAAQPQRGGKKKEERGKRKASSRPRRRCGTLTHRRMLFIQ